MEESPSQREVELMHHALGLASRGRGFVEPNPMVGCIIAREGEVIGSGFHERFGQPHAEPNALANCHAPTEGATAIVTLEPCCHTSKKTPPCAPRLIQAGISRVVIGHLDPNPQVAGQGAQQLRQAGIEVVSGVLEKSCQQLNAPFFALMRHGRPYVTLKWAQSADGLVGGAGNAPRQISGPESSRLVHALRSRSDAILVSADTVLADDPMLTPREVPVVRRPLRVALDTQLRIPETSRLISTALEWPTLVFTTAESPKASRLRERGVTIQVVPELDGHVDLDAVLRHLGGLRITHLMVEPGPRLARAFLERNLADRVWVIQSPQALDEPAAPQAVEVPFAATAQRPAGDDLIHEHLNPHSPVFFCTISTVDLSYF